MLSLREKATKGLEICRSHLEMGSGFCDQCPYFREKGCRFNMANDVFKVLKTQERVSAQLDKLCEWLAEEMKLPAPCYYREGICPYEDFGICRLDEAPDLKNCWKQFMTKWLEGLAYDPR